MTSCLVTDQSEESECLEPPHLPRGSNTIIGKLSLIHHALQIEEVTLLSEYIWCKAICFVRYSLLYYGHYWVVPWSGLAWCWWRGVIQTRSSPSSQGLGTPPVQQGQRLSPVSIHSVESLLWQAFHTAENTGMWSWQDNRYKSCRWHVEDNNGSQACGVLDIHDYTSTCIPTNFGGHS